MKTSYGYDTYRGRSKLQTALTVLIIILVIVLLLSVAAFFFLQKYMVYTDDGQARLELPFLQQESPPPSAPVQSAPLVIVTAEPAVSPSPQPTPVTVQIPEVLPVSLFRAAVTEGNARQLTEARGGNAALLNLKANDGSLGYVSSLPQAISLKSSESDPDLNQKLQTITASGLYTIARISCFKDNLAPKADGSLAVKTNSGYNWRDGEDVRWMNPSVKAVRDYIVGICAELAPMGFDELLLDNACWPTTGHLDYIKAGPDYDPAHLTEPLETFYQEVQTALEGQDILLSMAVNADALTGESALSGQTAALLGEYADRVYILGAEARGTCDEALAAVGLSGNAVVYVDSTLADLSTTGKAVWMP